MRALMVVAALTLSLSACGKDATSSADKVLITSSESTCSVAKKAFTSGDKVTFAVNNSGKDVTEVYVYGKGSSDAFDQVVGEVENIAPSTSRDFTVTLTGGDYEIACKPGQKGDGIRTSIEVSGEAPAPVASSDRAVSFTATDKGFLGLQAFSAKVGERIAFTLVNASAGKPHEFEVFGPDGKAIGEVGPTAPGKGGEVVLELKVAGTYTYESGIADDADKGLKGSFTVS